jgi:glutathione synthase/RimK-type ligase-like ATP-grasp enzyme
LTPDWCGKEPIIVEEIYRVAMSAHDAMVALYRRYVVAQQHIEQHTGDRDAIVVIGAFLVACRVVHRLRDRLASGRDRNSYDRLIRKCGLT